MGVVSQTVAVGQVLGTTPGIQYDAPKYTWIGRVNANVEVDHAWHASGVRNIQDVMVRETIAAGTGPTSSSVVMRRLMNELVGTKYKIVTGFQGPTSAQLAFERGEVDAIVKPWSSIKSGTPEWLRDKKIDSARPVHAGASSRIAGRAGDRRSRQGRRAAANPGLFAGGSPLGTALLAPPGLPDATATALAAPSMPRCAIRRSSPKPGRRRPTSSRWRARSFRRWSPGPSPSRRPCWGARRSSACRSPEYQSLKPHPAVPIALF